MSDYREVLQIPKVAFQSSELQNASVKQTPLGLPSLVSGGFALTACLTTQTNGMKSTWAIRCFHKEVLDLQERYQYISNFLQNKTDDFFVKFKYETEGINVQGKWYPIVKMAWVQGNSLSEYIQDNLNNFARLNSLANQVQTISKRLRELKMAHGDIQHGNVLVRDDGRLILIDYDGMYIPGMPYKNSNEIGHVAFQHPQRNSSFFNEKIDRFSSIIIYVSLLSLASSSGQYIWKKYHTGENLIFGRKDYQDPYNSPVFSELINNSQLAPLVTRLQQICRCHIDDIPTLNDFLNNSIDLSSLRTVAPLLLTSNLPDEIAAFSAKQTLQLVQQEGEKITVLGEVVNTHLYGYSGNILFINFGTFKDNKGKYNSFTIVIFSKGLTNFSRVKNLTIDELKNLKGKYLKVTGILELYPNEKKGFTTPQIIVEDPYQLTVVTSSEADDILNASTRRIAQPVKSTPPSTKSSIPTQTINTVPKPSPTRPIPTKPIPPKPVPPSQRQPANAKSAPTQIPSRSVPPSSSIPPKQTVRSNPSPATNTNSSQGDCFIATAVYGSKHHPDVETLRLFRDQVLLRYTVGKYFVSVYYKVGPHLANLVSLCLPLKQFIRNKLEKLAQWIREKNIHKGDFTKISK